MSSDPFTVSTVAEAALKLFNIKLAQYPKFKDAINTLLKMKGFIQQEDKPKKYDGDDHRYPTLILNDHLVKLHNAVLLQAFFKPREIKAIFERQQNRQDAADAIELIMINRQSILGVGLLAAEVVAFITMLRSDTDLSEEKLPNPFVELPQLSLNGVSNIMKELITQSAALSLGESMIVFYLNGDLEQAYSVASEMQSENVIVQKFKNKIITEYHQADEFDKTLDFLK
jgi:hypothetical protein|tara:strand:- start:1122 stop:1805 length:684 start_codon:yes stop_codon:yes gene_type:complete